MYVTIWSCYNDSIIHKIDNSISNYKFYELSNHYKKPYLAQLEYKTSMENAEPLRNEYQYKDQNLVGKLNVLSGFMNQIPEKPKNEKVINFI